jgi:glycerol-3-phosphate dehydrogenase (NAD(P)+)
MKQLEGVTLESIVIATRTARAVRKLADKQKAKLSDFPLLMHVDELISQNKRVDIPWQLFEDTFCE